MRDRPELCGVVNDQREIALQITAIETHPQPSLTVHINTRNTIHVAMTDVLTTGRQTACVEATHNI